MIAENGELRIFNARNVLVTVTGNTLALDSSSHTRITPQDLQLLQAFVAFKKTKKKKRPCTNRSSHTCFRSASSPVSSRSLSPSPIPLTELQHFFNQKASGEKRNKKTKHTHRLKQYMQGDVVFLDDKAFTHGRRGTDTETCRTSASPKTRCLPGNCEKVGELQKRRP